MRNEAYHAESTYLGDWPRVCALQRPRRRRNTNLDCIQEFRSTCNAETAAFDHAMRRPFSANWRVDHTTAFYHALFRQMAISWRLLRSSLCYAMCVRLSRSKNLNYSARRHLKIAFRDASLTFKYPTSPEGAPHGLFCDPSTLAVPNMRVKLRLWRIRIQLSTFQSLVFLIFSAESPIRIHSASIESGHNHMPAR